MVIMLTSGRNLDHVLEFYKKEDSSGHTYYVIVFEEQVGVNNLKVYPSEIFKVVAK